MPSHADRVRRNYLCPYCGYSMLEGEHGVLKSIGDEEVALVCTPYNHVTLLANTNVDFGEEPCPITRR